MLITDSTQLTVSGDSGGGEAGESGGAGQDVAVRAALCAETDDAITNLVHVAFLLTECKCFLFDDPSGGQVYRLLSPDRGAHLLVFLF